MGESSPRGSRGIWLRWSAWDGGGTSRYSAGGSGIGVIPVILNILRGLGRKGWVWDIPREALNPCWDPFPHPCLDPLLIPSRILFYIPFPHPHPHPCPGFPAVLPSWIFMTFPSFPSAGGVGEVGN